MDYRVYMDQQAYADSVDPFSAGILSTLSGVVALLSSQPYSRLAQHLSDLESVVNAMKKSAVSPQQSAPSPRGPGRPSAPNFPQHDARPSAPPALHVLSEPSFAKKPAPLDVPGAKTIAAQKHLDAADMAMAAAAENFKIGNIETAHRFRELAEHELQLAGKGMDEDTLTSAAPSRQESPREMQQHQNIAQVYDGQQRPAPSQLPQVLPYTTPSRLTQLSNTRPISNLPQFGAGTGLPAKTDDVDPPKVDDLPQKVQQTIDALGEVIVFNKLAPEQAFEAFDVDKDRLLSLSDLSTACKQLLLDHITGDHLQQFFKYADLDGDSFIEKDDWSYVLRQGSKFTFLEDPSSKRDDDSERRLRAQEKRVQFLRKMGAEEAAAKQYAEDGLNRRSAIVPQQQQIHSTPTAANPVPSTQTAAAQQQKPTPPRSIGLTEEEKAQMRVAAYIGEVLKYNKLTPAQGYSVFDFDQDGRVSLKDFHAVSKPLNLDLSAEALDSFFKRLDTKKSGYIEYEAWVITLGDAMR